jgi:phospho-N-acetylmuramoyl-pentapeptide-transferase
LSQGPLTIDPLCLLPALVSFVLTAAAFPFYIRWLKSKQIEQFIREEGPQSHAAKAKTPTMGGLCFISIAAVVSLGFLGASNHYLRFSGFVVVGISVLCGLIGFVDDFAKVTSKSNQGLSARSRLLVELGLGLLLSGLLYVVGASLDELVVGFAVPGAGLDWPAIFMPGAPAWLPATIQFAGPLSLAYMLLLVPFLTAATTNALNLHDGMDGLAAGTSVQVFVVLALLFYITGQGALAMVASAVAGSLAGFLIYNKYPAKVFMGDTGSLFIGGALAALVAASGLLLWFIPLSVIYIAEAISVMAQVVYFKLTKDYQSEKPLSAPALVWLKLTKRLPGEGKRLFRMAPLHHHYEAVAHDKGIPEYVVVGKFWLAQLAICCLVVLLALVTALDRIAR